MVSNKRLAGKSRLHKYEFDNLGYTHVGNATELRGSSH